MKKKETKNQRQIKTKNFIIEYTWDLFVVAVIENNTKIDN